MSKANDRTMAGPIPNNDDEAGYHRHLTRTINARYGEAIKVWEERIVEHVSKHDEQTIELAKHLDKLQRRGVDAEQVLDLAVRHKPLLVDRPTAALAYRLRASRLPSSDGQLRRPTRSIGDHLSLPARR